MDNYCYVLSASGSPAEYRYIGETHDLKQRLYDHLYTAKTTKKNYPLINWIKKRIKVGEKILITPLCICERDTYEINLIANGRKLGWKLLNVQDGGTTSGGMKNKKHSEISKKKMSKSGKGKPKTQEHKDNIAKALANRQFSEEHLSKLSISAKQKPKVICEHCGISLMKSNYTKWHGNKCKKRSV